MKLRDYDESGDNVGQVFILLTTLRPSLEAKDGLEKLKKFAKILLQPGYEDNSPEEQKTFLRNQSLVSLCYKQALYLSIQQKIKPEATHDEIFKGFPDRGISDSLRGFGVTSALGLVTPPIDFFLTNRSNQINNVDTLFKYISKIIKLRDWTKAKDFTGLTEIFSHPEIQAIFFPEGYLPNQLSQLFTEAHGRLIAPAITYLKTLSTPPAQTLIDALNNLPSSKKSVDLLLVDFEGYINNLKTSLGQADSKSAVTPKQSAPKPAITPMGLDAQKPQNSSCWASIFYCCWPKKSNIEHLDADHYYNQSHPTPGGDYHKLPEGPSLS